MIATALVALAFASSCQGTPPYGQILEGATPPYAQILEGADAAMRTPPYAQIAAASLVFQPRRVRLPR